MTVADAIETVRLMDNPDAISPQNPQGAVSISPDGKRYVARLIRGDIKSNGVRVDLIAGRMDSLDEAARYEVIARLFTTGLGSASSLFGAIEDTNAYSTPIRWIDDDRIVFLWSNERGIRQLTRVTLSTHRIEYLTDHPTHLVTFVGLPDELPPSWMWPRASTSSCPLNCRRCNWSLRCAGSIPTRFRSASAMVWASSTTGS